MHEPSCSSLNISGFVLHEGLTNTSNAVVLPFCLANSYSSLRSQIKFLLIHQENFPWYLRPFGWVSVSSTRLQAPRSQGPVLLAHLSVFSQPGSGVWALSTHLTKEGQQCPLPSPVLHWKVSLSVLLASQTPHAHSQIDLLFLFLKTVCPLFGFSHFF